MAIFSFGAIINNGALNIFSMSLGTRLHAFLQDIVLGMELLSHELFIYANLPDPQTESSSLQSRYTYLYS